MPTTLILFSLTLAIGAFGTACVLAKRVGVVVPFAFIAVYVMARGCHHVHQYRCIPSRGPQVSCWFSRPSTWRNATALLGVYLFLMLVAIEIAWALDVQFLFLVGEFALLSMIFLTIAHWKSKQAYRRPSDYTASRTHDV
jgi:hypothetical protein